MKFSEKRNSYCAVICLAFAVRSIVSLYSYSGAAKPPMHGDYEAQRHWQEVCVNLPASSWYTNSSDNDLLYWGLDYPPLTAYHSWSLGKIAKYINPLYIELNTSRGFESDGHKLFMRLSVLAADLVIYIPAILLVVSTINLMHSRKQLPILEIQHLAVFLLYPGQILIDNGHFQYNNISLGLATLAVVGIMLDLPIVASICFSLALNYKQMELYHAIPFFVYLLQSCTREKSIQNGLLKLTRIGASVVITFALLWLPWIGSWNSFITVVRRLFPINRGVFEDKVSNVWCAVNVVIKLKTLFSNESMALICLVATALALLPNAIHLYRNPTKMCFLYALFNSAMSFFLFSFQVHEKSILLPALPAMMLYPFEPFMVTWFLQISTISMFPLLEKDNLTLPFIAMCLIFQTLTQIIIKTNLKTKYRKNYRFKWLYHSSSVINLLLVICYLCAPTPHRLPHLYVLGISVFSCLHFAAFNIYTVYKQFEISKNASIKELQ